MADIYWCDKAIYQRGIICNRGNSRTIRDQIDEDNIEIVLPQSNAYRFFFWGKTTGVIKALPTSGFKFLNQRHILNFFHRHPLRITIVNTGKKVSFTCVLQKSVPIKCFTWCCLNSCIEKKEKLNMFYLSLDGWTMVLAILPQENSISVKHTEFHIELFPPPAFPIPTTSGCLHNPSIVIWLKFSWKFCSVTQCTSFFSNPGNKAHLHHAKFSLLKPK